MLSGDWLTLRIVLDNQSKHYPVQSSPRPFWPHESRTLNRGCHASTVYCTLEPTHHVTASPVVTTQPGFGLRAFSPNLHLASLVRPSFRPILHPSSSLCHQCTVWERCAFRSHTSNLSAQETTADASKRTWTIRHSRLPCRTA